jgi:hypothetical protein
MAVRLRLLHQRKVKKPRWVSNRLVLADVSSSEGQVVQKANLTEIIQIF